MIYEDVRGNAAKITPKHPLFEVVSQAYRVFSAYEPEGLGVCEGFWMHPKIEADFFGPAIEKLPLYYLYDWYFAGPMKGNVSQSTWGYLLPRILEVLALGEHVNGLCLESSLSCFETGNRAQWSAEEWEVLDGFQRQYLARILRHKSRGQLDETLCMFWEGGWPLADLLTQLEDSEDAVLARRLWRDWCVEHDPSLDGIKVSLFWKGAVRAQIIDYYTSPELSARMKRLAEGAETPKSVAKKARAVAGIVDAKTLRGD